MAEPSYNRTLGRIRLVGVYLALTGLVALARPTIGGVAAGSTFVLAGLTLRAWASGHLVKNVTLVTSGPYRYTRNPLYLGRLLVFFGLCLMARLPYGLNWVALVAGLLVFFAYYLPRKERVEPARLAELHGEAFQRYREQVPALWPRLRPYAADPGQWSAALALRNREHWMIAAFLLVTLYLLWRS